MKLLNIFFALSFLLLFTACNPLEDIENEFEVIQQASDTLTIKNKDKIIPPNSYTLQDADYAKSPNKAVSENKYFSINATVEDNLPVLLNELFVAKEVGYATNVSYNEYINGAIVDGPVAADKVLTDSDYKIHLGLSFPNFGSFEEAKGKMAKLAELILHFSEQTQQVIEFKYTANEIRYGKWSFSGTDWVQNYEAIAGKPNVAITEGAIEITEEDYKSFGGDPEEYNNFDSGDKPTKHLPNFLKTKYPTASDGDVLFIKYVYSASLKSL